MNSGSPLKRRSSRHPKSRLSLRLVCRLQTPARCVNSDDGDRHRTLCADTFPLFAPLGQLTVLPFSITCPAQMLSFETVPSVAIQQNTPATRLQSPATHRYGPSQRQHEPADHRNRPSVLRHSPAACWNTPATRQHPPAAHRHRSSAHRSAPAELRNAPPANRRTIADPPRRTAPQNV